MKTRFIDLFAGIGGFHVALESIGWECVFANEWDKYAAKTYQSWTGFEVNTQDINKLDKNNFPAHEVLCAGFPCQPFSIAGVSKKISLGRSHGFDDVQQGNLFFQIAEIIRIKKPAVVILENVKNLKSHDKGKTWQIIEKTISDLGYELRHQVIDAQNWVPQHRERIFIVAFNRKKFTKSEITSFRFPIVVTRNVRLKNILEKNPDKKYMLTDNLWRYLRDYAKKHKRAGNGFGFGLVDGSGISRTLSARYYKDGSEVLIRQEGWRNPRRLTPREAARLMGFDEDFSRARGFGKDFPQVVSDMQAYKQLGNSVCPHAVKAIGLEVSKVLKLRDSRLSKKVKVKASKLKSGKV